MLRSVGLDLWITITSKFKMRWFLLCLARYSAAQKALEPRESNYTCDMRLYGKP